MVGADFELIATGALGTGVVGDQGLLGV